MQWREVVWVRTVERLKFGCLFLLFNLLCLSLCLELYSVLKELESFVRGECLLVLGLSCCFGSLSIEEFSQVQIWILLLQISYLLVK